MFPKGDVPALADAIRGLLARRTGGRARAAGARDNHPAELLAEHSRLTLDLYRASYRPDARRRRANSRTGSPA